MKARWVLGAILILTLAGCSSPALTKTRSGATITLHLQTPTRTLVADWPAQLQSIRLNLVREADTTYPTPISTTQTEPYATSVTMGGFQSGTWNGTVEGLDSTNAVVLQASVNSLVLSGTASTTLAVDLKPLQTATGTGAYSLELWFPATITQVSGQLTNLDGSPVSGQTFTLDGTQFTTVVAGITQAATFSGTGVASGKYRLILQLSVGTSVVKTVVEAVNIWDNVLTNQWVNPADGTLQAYRELKPSQFASTDTELADLRAEVGSTNLLSTFDPATSSYQASYLPSASAQQVTVTAVAGAANQYQNITWTTDVPVTGTSVFQPFTAGSSVLPLPHTGTSVVVRVEPVVNGVALADLARDYTVTLHPKKFLLKATEMGAFWTDFVVKTAPAGTVSLAGISMGGGPNGSSTLPTSHLLYALDDAATLWETSGVGWTKVASKVPAGAQWIAAGANGGTFLAASPSEIWIWDPNFPTPLTTLPNLAVKPIKGILMTKGGPMVWGGSTNQLWQWDSGSWSEFATVPAGTTSVALSPWGTIIAQIGDTAFREWTAGIWTITKFKPLPGTLASTSAFGQFVSLILKEETLP